MANKINKIQSIRGMHDILPEQSALWQFFETTVKKLLQAYSYKEIRMPIVESTDLFCRSIGEVTDIVEKEMYSFADRNGDSLTLRPEGTASCVRSGIQHGLFHNQQQRLWYMGPMFRHERPQKGRYRQFHQIGAEVLGVEDPKIDAQVLAMLHQYFCAIGIDAVSLQVNSLGCPECRPAYRQQLIDYLEQRLAQLCPDCQRRYLTNPLRVLDCKATGCQQATVDAPAAIDHLCGDCDEHFAAVKKHLQALGVPFEINARMVRGLDYYVRTTFELVTDQLGSQNAVAAGGRYDGLVESLGGPALPGIGFAIGVERLVLMKGADRVVPAAPELFIAALGDAAADQAFVLMSHLQKNGIRAEMDYQTKSLKSQMRRANKFSAAYTLVLGEDELRSGQANLKKMADGSQIEVSLDSLLETLQRLLPES